MVDYLKVHDVTLGYCHTSGKEPGILFCGGFSSDMTSSKALFLEEWALSQGYAFTRFDYSGHGVSSGAFTEGSIGLWYADALAILDYVTTGRQIIVGSSMGGWIMLLLTIARPERVAALLGIAAAPDFTEELIWNQLTLAQRTLLEKKGHLLYECPDTEDPPLTITHHLLQEGRKHCLLSGPISIDCPVRLLHGLLDQDVSWRYGPRLQQALRSKDVQLTLVKDAAHRFSRESDLSLIIQTVQHLIQDII